MIRNQRIPGIARGVLGAGALALVMALTLPIPAAALSIVDIIQLSQNDYSEEEIIKLIEVTESAFELEAADLPRLKDLGVREAVIRVMLERVPAAKVGAESDENSEGRS